MIPHLGRSRLLKAITDRPEFDVDFETAEQRLASVLVSVVVDPSQARTLAGQAAAITAVAIAMKCFGRVVLVVPTGVELIKPLPLGGTLEACAKALGATHVTQSPIEVSHVVGIGSELAGLPCFIRCWWDDWIAGVLPQCDARPYGASRNPLAGVFAGALAVREVFAHSLGARRAGRRVSIASLWEPWNDPATATMGPAKVYLPPSLWFVGLGHLGQGFLWSLGMLPKHGTLVVLQDDQMTGEENVATGLLTTDRDVGSQKTRVAARWLEALGWQTALLERRNYGDGMLLSRDPAIVLTSIDEPLARSQIAEKAGFEWMIDAGVGHGPTDFDGMQLRILKKGTDPKGFWSAPEKPKDVDALMLKRAYQAHAGKSERCGTFALAEASVAVPFVGAAAGAVTIAQLLRLGAMQETPRMIQMDLPSPELVMSGGMNLAPTTSLGSVECAFC